MVTVERRWEYAWNKLSRHIGAIVMKLEYTANRVITALEKASYVSKKEYTLAEINAFASQICNRLGIDIPHIVLHDIVPSNYTMHNPYTLIYTGTNTVYINQLHAWRIGIPVEMVVAHEIRHYYQNVTGRLAPDYLGTLWDGEPVEAGWYDSPWEADAVEYENKVAIELGLPISRIVVDGKVYDHGNRKATRG